MVLMQRISRIPSSVTYYEISSSEILIDLPYSETHGVGLVVDGNRKLCLTVTILPYMIHAHTL